MGGTDKKVAPARGAGISRACVVVLSGALLLALLRLRETRAELARRAREDARSSEDPLFTPL